MIEMSWRIPPLLLVHVCVPAKVLEPCFFDLLNNVNTEDYVVGNQFPSCVFKGYTGEQALVCA